MEASNVLIADSSCVKKLSPNFNILIIEPCLSELVYVPIPEPNSVTKGFDLSDWSSLGQVTTSARGG